MRTGTLPVKHWCQHKRRPCEYANSWGKCLMTACIKHGGESLTYTTTCNQTCNQKQVTGKLDSVEIATSEDQESIMNQLKSKLDRPDWQKEIEEEYEFLHWDIR